MRALKDHRNVLRYADAYQKARNHLQNSQKHDVEWSSMAMEEYLQEVEIPVDYPRNSGSSVQIPIPKKQTMVNVDEDREQKS